MKERTLQATLGGLLHDCGKPVYRAGGERGSHSRQGYAFLQSCLKGDGWQPVLDCVRWHHAAELRRADCPADSPAYLVYLADNLSAAADRREVEGEGGSFRRDLPLASVFTHLNGSHPGCSVPPCPQDGTLHQPGRVQSLPATAYRDAVRCLQARLPDLRAEDCWVNSLLGLLETQWSCFPSSTFTGESPDISLYDHSKTTAAIAACLSEYLADRGIHDLRTALFTQEAAFREEQAFLLYTADVSGIQKFLYTVHTSGALKSLRSRSFFLELLMEHYIDELLAGCGLSRANLIYSGGGHCYLLLPNTLAAVDAAREWNRCFNGWLQQQFGSQMFLAHAWEPCSGNTLTNTPAADTPYKELFRRVNRGLEHHKFHRYSPADLRRLNSDKGRPDGRECKVCGVSAGLENDLCPWCLLFTRLSDKIQRLSGKVQRQSVFLVSRDAAQGGDFRLPAQNGGEVSVTLTDENAARRRLEEGEQVLRVYTKNQPFTGRTYSTNLYVGDYAARNSMEELADRSQGVKRIAVCRMDVDDLGHAFVAGFEQPEQTDPVRRMHYVTLSRTAAFSRQMSLFFRCYINGIVDGLFISIVYAGGDDVFLVGAWNDILEAAQRIQSAFSRFCCGALTLSAGIGIFPGHYPIRLAAADTAALEQAAKDLPGKNAAALFTPGRSAVPNPAGEHLPPLVSAEQGHVYHWDTLRTEVLGEKLACLTDFFRGADADRGNAMLYNLLSLLRDAEENPIDLARYAYQLARLRPPRSDPRSRVYNAFAEKMMAWSIDAAQRRELITAIYIDVYQNRKEGVRDDI